MAYANDKKCLPILEKYDVFKTSVDFSEFMELKLPDALDQMAILVNDIELYVKRNLWYYANMICTVCNPREN